MKRSAFWGMVGVMGFAFGAARAAQADVASAGRADVVRTIAVASGQKGYTEVEALGDELFHIQLTLSGAAPALPAPEIPATPYIVQKAFPGPSHAVVAADGQMIETASYRVTVTAGPCVSLSEKSSGAPLAQVCATPAQDGSVAGLTLAKLGMVNAYGLGEEFRTPGQPNGDWIGSVRSSKNTLGNSLEAYEGGGVANALFPILYALGDGTTGYAIYVDDVQTQTWDMTGDPWKVALASGGDTVRFYLIGGADLPALRHHYMDLTGHPPVPPQKAFGMWLSEFGYRNWGEMDDKLKTLRQHHFPIDGFVLDAYWCGPFATSDVHNHIGAMTFDTKNFPDPAGKIAKMRDKEGLGLMLHEDPFIDNLLDAYKDMDAHGGLVRKSAGGAPRVIDNYLGDIGVIDWSNEPAAAYWHQSRRQPLMDMGVDFHWTDFAEVDGYDGDDWYAGASPLVGHTSAENHNYFSFAWAKSIADGYALSSKMRPFILSRSGTPGVQRFGSAFWSGDIGSNLVSLAAHLNAQMHLSLSGIDYFGSDAGGYHRDALQGDLNDVYTKWFAHSAAFDVPLRPHTNDWDKKQQTAPDRVGDMASNLANLRLRYELSPYYYSLAHLAYLGGDPMFPPLVYYFQSDAKVREIGDEKMIGPSILVAAAPVDGPVSRDVYLPAGNWVDYRTGKAYASAGQTFHFDYQANGGLFQLPYLVHEGAILPILWVDDDTMNVLGRRTDGKTITDLNLRVYPAAKRTAFPIFEDDGQTIAYKQGAVARTLVTQQLDVERGIAAIDVMPTAGTYDGAPSSRRVVARVVLPVDGPASPVGTMLNGQALIPYPTRDAFEKADSGWFWDSTQATVIVRTPSLPVGQAKQLRIVLRKQDALAAR